MFGFITKFKTEVYDGFESVKQRLVTLEAKVEALFEHTKTTAEAAAKDVAAPVEAAVAEVKTETTDAKQDTTAS